MQNLFPPPLPVFIQESFPVTTSSEANIVVVFLYAAYLFLLASLIPLLITMTLGAIHWWIRAARERLEGTHTAAAQGSRAGEKLGAGAAVLVSVASLLAATGGSFEYLSPLLLLYIVPVGLWGMLSGSIAGQCSTRTGAVTVGALMFLLGRDPVGLYWAITALVGNAFQGNAGAQQSLEFWGVALLHLALGAVVGNAAFRLGRQRAAEMAGGTDVHTRNVPVAVSPTIAQPTTPAAQWHHLG